MLQGHGASYEHNLKLDNYAGLACGQEFLDQAGNRDPVQNRRARWKSALAETCC